MNRSAESGQIRLRVAFRNLFYTTIYVAVEGGFLAEQGLDVDFAHIPAGQASTELLKAGAIDISQSGISRSLMDLDAGSNDPPLHIAEINQRMVSSCYLVSPWMIGSGPISPAPLSFQWDSRRCHS